MSFNKSLNEYLSIFNKNLDVFVQGLSDLAPKKIVESIVYSIKNGGKRVRPCLLYASAKMLNVDFEKVHNYALAIELIHSYSLVHDDLPAMDNDDFRRGKLSTHKKFGEDIGILAGDAMLNLAIETCLKNKDFSQFDAKACSLLFEYAGYQGMIGGQVLDLDNNSDTVNANKDYLYSVYLNKTAKLLTAPLLIASILSCDKYYQNLKEYGYNVGYTFQIIDDILDVTGSLETIGKTPNKDSDVNKLTSVKIFGLEGAKNLAKLHYEKALLAIKDIPNNEFLVDFAKMLYERNN